ncbi:CLUMA_CG007284, isoform A [Clunio marinus]|uniref:CLUMA_CG007284, isoform A n=1 Tax=Clunio marinus TaxID=568069 RepID=A0A1J1I2D6_9DIPT|nr:CLUMA_CG007284, isoform A [Clunio marinus]
MTTKENSFNALHNQSFCALILAFTQHQSFDDWKILIRVEWNEFGKIKKFTNQYFCSQLACMFVMRVDKVCLLELQTFPIYSLRNCLERSKNGTNSCSTSSEGQIVKRSKRHHKTSAIIVEKTILNPLDRKQSRFVDEIKFKNAVELAL